MFRPPFANLAQLDKENTSIIAEGDHLGKIFFKDIYNNLHLHICEYSFEEHDRVVAYSLGVPYASTLVFASTMQHQAMWVSTLNIEPSLIPDGNPVEDKGLILAFIFYSDLFSNLNLHQGQI